VRDNVFKHQSLWGVITPYQTSPGALTQSESGLVPANNQLGVDESGHYEHCDFDGDHVTDTFFATGATWWYSSGGTAAWRYLNTSTRRLSQLNFGDFDDDGRCDVLAGGMISSGGTGPWRSRAGGIVWRNTDGRFALWSLNGGTIVGEVYRADVDNSWQVRGAGDFNGDRSDDILWENTSRQLAIWQMSKLTQVTTIYPRSDYGPDAAIQGVGDFDGDGASDILRRDTYGVLSIWFKGNPYDPMYPAAHPSYHNLNTREPVGQEWRVVGVGDFNGDGRSDILWRRSTDGQVGIWHMAGGVRASDIYPGQGVPTLLWTIAGVGDFDADGRADILWRDASGAVAIWLSGEAERAVYPSYGNGGAPFNLAWQIQGAADYNSDGRTDILWRHKNGQLAIWFMAGGRFLGDAYPRTVEASWEIKAVFSHPR
jgi:FG-GAP-like repeat